MFPSKKVQVNIGLSPETAGLGHLLAKSRGFKNLVQFAVHLVEQEVINSQVELHIAARDQFREIRADIASLDSGIQQIAERASSLGNQ
jgi:hypothetical protein